MVGVPSSRIAIFFSPLSARGAVGQHHDAEGGVRVVGVQIKAAKGVYTAVFNRPIKAAKGVYTAVFIKQSKQQREYTPRCLTT